MELIKDTKEKNDEIYIHYKYEDISVYLKLDTPITTKHIIWYQPLRCVLFIEYNILNLREESRYSITSLQAPALLLKQMGLLKGITLIDDNNTPLKKEQFRAYDIGKTLKTTDIESMNSIFNASFSSLFAEGEGWKSSEIAPHLKKLYKLVYSQRKNIFMAAKNTSNFLTQIKTVNKKRAERHKKKLRKENEIRRQKLENRYKSSSNLLAKAVLQPKDNFESNDSMSMVGSIVYILILLKRYHLQYIERTLNAKKNQNVPYLFLEYCTYNKNKAKSCKISINKLLESYISTSTNHTKLGKEFHSILLFNSALSKELEYQIILWLARIETAFITPLDIIKKFLFYHHDAWLSLPIPISLIDRGPKPTTSMNFAAKAFSVGWNWEKYPLWPDFELANEITNGIATYNRGLWAEYLMEDYYTEQLEILFAPNNSTLTPDIHTLAQRFHLMRDYITLLSIQPTSNLDAMPDVSKWLDKSNDQDIFWKPINRFPIVVAKLEMKRAYQKELNYINKVKSLQSIIDLSLLNFSAIYQINTNDINTLHTSNNYYEFTNKSALARYITNSTDNTSTKNFINWFKNHQQHIDYYIMNTIDQIAPLVLQKKDKVEDCKTAYVIALKVLYQLYNRVKKKSNNKFKRILFPARNCDSPNNESTEILRDFLFKPIIICLLLHLDLVNYFYQPLKLKLKKYNNFVDFLYNTESTGIEWNLLRK